MSSRGHVPQRLCAGCGRRFAKSDLVRFTASGGSGSGRSKGGVIVPDRSGKGGGRGAYICPNLSCFDGATGKRGFLPRRLGGAALEPELRNEFVRLINEMKGHS